MPCNLDTSDPCGTCEPCMERHFSKGEVMCRGCGRWVTTVYCDTCARLATCAHGNIVADGCDACDVEGDIAYDLARGSK
jgi:hypothetical protein